MVSLIDHFAKETEHSFFNQMVRHINMNNTWMKLTILPIMHDPDT